jgi:hypothetical protein
VKITNNKLVPAGTNFTAIFKLLPYKPYQNYDYFSYVTGIPQALDKGNFHIFNIDSGPFLFYDP